MVSEAFKHDWKKLFNEWTLTGDHALTPDWRIKMHSVTLLCKRNITAWQCISPAATVKGFIRSDVYPTQWMAVKRLEMLGERGICRHWLCRWREWHWVVKVDRMWHVLYINCMKSIVKHSDVHRSIHHNTFLQYNQPDAPISQIIYSCKTLYMFWTVFQSVIRSSKLHIRQQACVLFWAPDDGRKDRPKHVGRFTRINNLRNRCTLLVVLYE